jgi:hypothetical protein
MRFVMLPSPNCTLLFSHPDLCGIYYMVGCLVPFEDYSITMTILKFFCVLILCATDIRPRYSQTWHVGAYRPLLVRHLHPSLSMRCFRNTTELTQSVTDLLVMITILTASLQVELINSPILHIIREREDASVLGQVKLTCINHTTQ